MAELRPRADAVRQRIEAAFASVAEAGEEWREVASVWESHADSLQDSQRRSPDPTGLDERILDLSNFTVPDPIGRLSPGAEARLGAPVPAAGEPPTAAPEPTTPPAEVAPPAAESAPPVVEPAPPLVARAAAAAASTLPDPPSPAVEPTPAPAPPDVTTGGPVAISEPGAPPRRRRAGLLRWRRSPPREQIP